MPMLVWNLRSARIDEDRFWDFVGEVVEEVFDGRGGDRIELLRRQLTGRPEGERVPFYHREPLDVAGQLAEVDQIDGTRLERYRRLKAERGWASVPQRTRRAQPRRRLSPLRSLRQASRAARSAMSALAFPTGQAQLRLEACRARQVSGQGRDICSRKSLFSQRHS